MSIQVTEVSCFGCLYELLRGDICLAFMNEFSRMEVRQWVRFPEESNSFVIWFRGGFEAIYILRKFMEIIKSVVLFRVLFCLI